MGDMKSISRYSLQPRMIRGAKSERSHLLLDGVDTGRFITGIDLLAQYQNDVGVLLICDFDCPFDESIVLQLLDKHSKTIAHCVLPERQSNNLLYRSWLDGDSIVLHLYDQQFFRVVISKRTIWSRWRGEWRIDVRAIASGELDAAMEASILRLEETLADVRRAMVDQQPA